LSMIICDIGSAVYLCLVDLLYWTLIVVGVVLFVIFRTQLSDAEDQR
jgi:hypothetical protein